MAVRRDAATTTRSGWIRLQANARSAIGSVGAEVPHLPPRTAHQDAERQRSDVVPLARSTGHDDGRAILGGHHVDRAGREPAADEMAGEVLLRDADGSGLPSLADLDQERHQHAGDGLVKVEPLENLVQDALGGGLVVIGQSREKPPDEGASGRLHLVLLDPTVYDFLPRQVRSKGSRHACGAMS
jgi:hypothetical protein